jgi:copper resistance protein B
MRWEPDAFLLSELLEYTPNGANPPMRYDVLGWVGGAYNRLWAKAEGEQSTRSGAGETEIQLLYGRLVSPFWDAQVGLRVDVGYGEGDRRLRALAALGVQGLAPGWFELEPTVFISQDGDVAANLTASYDLLFTQRLIAQARFETNVAVQSVPEFGVGSGINDVDLGLRVRYEIWRGNRSGSSRCWPACASGIEAARSRVSGRASRVLPQIRNQAEPQMNKRDDAGPPGCRSTGRSGT